MCAPIATSKISVRRLKHTTQKFSDMLPLSPRIWQCVRQFLVKRPKILAATSNFHEEQNLVHLGRFCILAKKWLE